MFLSVEIQSELTEESNISNQDGSTVFCACIIRQVFCRSSYILPWSWIGSEGSSVTGNPCGPQGSSRFPHDMLFSESYLFINDNPSVVRVIKLLTGWKKFVSIIGFSLFLCVKTGSGADPTFKWIGTGGKQDKSDRSIRLTSDFRLVPRVIIRGGITSISRVI